MTATREYLNHDETTALLELELATTDQRRLAYEGASEDDRTVFRRAATADLDALLWDGEKLSTDQTLMWPRWNPLTHETIEPDPDEGSTPTVASMPADIKRACAIQTAKNALEGIGLSQLGFERAGVLAGITSHSQGGISTSYDVQRAARPIAKIDPQARMLIEKYLRRGAEIV